MFSEPNIKAIHHHARDFGVASAGATDTGLERNQNEDRFGIYPEIGLFIVADGMGGTAGGEVAAQMAVELVYEAFVDPEVTWPIGFAVPGCSGVPWLVAAIERANYRIHHAAQQSVHERGMGTMLAAVLAEGERAVIAHVGDSRVYRLRDRRLALLTEDHSLFNDLVRAGVMEPEDRKQFEHRNVITRAIGSDATVAVEWRSIAVAPGDTFLLCSDGLSSVVGDREVEEILVSHANLDEAAERLIALANALGGPDNITVVLVQTVWGSARG